MWLAMSWWVVLLTTVTVVVVTRISTGLPAWARPMPRWCRRLPWRRVSLPNWSTVSWRIRKCSPGEAGDNVGARDAPVGGAGFGQGVVGALGRRAWVVGAVGPLGVVDVAEFVEKVLQVGQVRGPRSCS